MTIEIKDLAGRIDDALASVAAGVEVVITRGNVPLARLLPTTAASAKARVAGLHAGAIKTTADFDAPLDDAFWTGAP